MRTQRKLKDSLVIVCEGTDTEYLYFSDIAKIVQTEQSERFGLIRVVPTPKEVDEMVQVRQAYKKKMRPDASGTSHPEWLYYVKEDHSQKEYDYYKACPTRYVREAQLFLEDGDFTEAWAVYDKDVHPGHERAIELANKDQRLHIAYSSYSFEEWILCHFERNSYPYRKSICEIKNCDFNSVKCKGHDCLIGRIRKKGYISELKKNTSGLYAKYLAPRIEQAIINVAWLRFVGRIHKKEIGLKLYQLNPYTTIDEFMIYLMNMPACYEWHSLNEYFVFEKDKFIFNVEGDELIIAYSGYNVHLLRDERLFYCDSMGNRSSSLLHSPQNLFNGKLEIRLKVNKKERYIRFEEPQSVKYKIVILELPFFG